MKKLITFLCILFSFSVSAQTNDAQNSIKDISSELASINQQIVEISQTQKNETQIPVNSIQIQQSETGMIQMKIPVAAFRNLASISHEKKPSAQQNQTQDIYEIIINKMRALKKKYDNNPYIKITGFEINIGITPSVTISMEFQK